MSPDFIFMRNYESQLQRPATNDGQNWLIAFDDDDVTFTRIVVSSAVATRRPTQTQTQSNQATRKDDVGAECRHDMRPSVQLPSVSGVDSKLDLTVARPSLQSAPEPSALDPPSFSKHARLLWRFLTSGDLDLWPSQLKICSPLTRAIPILIFLLFCFRVTSQYGSTGA